LNELRKSIKKNGLFYPIIINENDFILDGHHRYLICNENSIEPKTSRRVFEDKLDEKEFVLDSNVKRRQLSVWQRCELGEKYWDIEKERTKRTYLATLPKDGQKGFQPVLDHNEVSHKDVKNKYVKALKIAARKANVGHETLRKAKTILETVKEKPEKFSSLLKALNNETVSVNAAFAQVNSTRQTTKTRIILPLPKNKYRTIIIDPAWKTQKIIRKVRPNQTKNFDYPTMNIEEIKALPIKTLAHKNCHIYLWITHKYLPVGFELFEHWGVKYQCILTWVKNIGFTPFSWMYSTEHILFGRIGSLDLLQKGLRLDFTAKVREHSRKPNEFYDLVKKVSPEPRIDLFAREKHEGFDIWGNEIDRF